jgi:endonuclease III
MPDSAALVIDGFDSTSTRRSSDRPSKRNARCALLRCVGEPGAERFLLLMRARKTLPLDSNGARTMVRLGYGVDDKTYARMYRLVASGARADLVMGFDWLSDAHVLLRRRGQQACKTSAPKCQASAMRHVCACAPMIAR